VRAATAGLITFLAVLLLWFALVAPDKVGRLTPLGFVRIPFEGLVLLTLVLVVPRRARRVVAALVGIFLGVLLILKTLDMGFYAALGRPFDPVIDWSYFGSAASLLGDSIGRGRAAAFVIAAGLIGVAILVLMPLSALRVTRLANQHRGTAVRALGVSAVVWMLFAGIGLQLGPIGQVASANAIGLTWHRIDQVRSDLHDQRTFAKLLAADPVRNTPANELLTGLRGKDVVIAFVESYGRVAVQDSSFSPQVDTVLDDGTNQLRAAGFSSRSAYLTSPTFGGISWLAHSTLQSGLWVDNQLKYNELVGSSRFTVSDAFKRAGWRTVVDVPANDRDWPQARSFYHYDAIYDSRNVGYVGPKFGYATMPDQYVLSAFQRQELATPHRAPIMAEIDLVSSHTPWTPLPTLVDWNKLGDGSVFDGMPEDGPSRDAVWRDSAHVQAAYGRSIQYSLNALVSFVTTYHDKNLVLVVLGDHQPATIVSGQDAGHDVPITIIARDPAVMTQISGWGWENGMRPSPNAPVWPMNAFRNRFLSAYGG
jgi:hypothetical protein